MTVTSTVGERIRAVRLMAGLAQDRFATALGYSRRALINWEQGLAEPPIGILAKLRREYDVDPEWVVLGDDTIPRSHYGQIDRERFGRIKRDVDAACSQVGMELDDEVRLSLIHDLYDEEPGADEANRKRLRQTLLALSKGQTR